METFFFYIWSFVFTRSSIDGEEGHAYQQSKTFSTVVFRCLGLTTCICRGIFDTRRRKLPGRLVFVSLGQHLDVGRHGLGMDLANVWCSRWWICTEQESSRAGSCSFSWVDTSTSRHTVSGLDFANVWCSRWWICTEQAITNEDTVETVVEGLLEGG